MYALMMMPIGDTLDLDIDNTLAAFQFEVGGYIAPVFLNRNAVLIVNQNAKIAGMAINERATALACRPIHGIAVLAGVIGEELTDAPGDLVMCAHAMVPSRRCAE